ncbi:hypothetical protein CUU66_22525 [Peribacillus deserti]|uniref:Uncharacterized protein n=1 Tax=Peribacillus deserti TaxID=673318 RepID=A0A2N5LZZ4_9BACI|nr:hypothetical protein CUU66_22525 [Peribacillus deserti]
MGKRKSSPRLATTSSNKMLLIDSMGRLRGYYSCWLNFFGLCTLLAVSWKDLSNKHLADYFQYVRIG